jgi:acetyl-CoA carboxylase beta subunit
MYNPLDEIYADYKKNGFDKKRRDIGTNGVPDPVFDSEFEANLNNVRCCPDCGSINVSMDMSTNKTVCKDCNKSSDTPHRVDFQKRIEQEKEKDLKNMELAIKRGGVFGKVS